MSDCVFENELLVIRQADFCAVPGYLVLSLKNNAESWGDLSIEQAQQLGVVMSKTIAAMEQVTGADRVYCLSFCEQLRTLHFHLLPRTTLLLQRYHQATGTGQEPVNGPLLFEWVRDTYPAGSPLPAGFSSVAAIGSQLRDRLQ